VDCGRGVRLLDLGRWGAPYHLTPGGGTAMLINTLIWDCDQPVTLADSSNRDIVDRGSHVAIDHCLIPGLQQGVINSGVYSTVTWLEGNIEGDPLFVDVREGDFHVLSYSPIINTGTATKAPDHDFDGDRRPCGNHVDIGAYEWGYCPVEP